MTLLTTTMRLDEEVKGQARPILDELGLNISSAVNIFLRAVVRSNGLPFNLSLDSKENQEKQTIDFSAEYLAPLMSERNVHVQPGSNPNRTRERLLKRKTFIYQGRRDIG